MDSCGLGRKLASNSVSKLLDPRRIGVQARLLEQKLKRMVVGQAVAIEAITNTYQMYLSGLAEADRPVGSFLFLGPTGTGKTRIVEALAEALVGNPAAVIKIDCAEFQHSHEIAKLIGSPPGYLGHRETHPVISQEVLSRYYTHEVKLSFVLFDEIEKASDAVWNLLLGILDKGKLTLGDNRTVDFSRALIFLTSNLGAREMQSILAPQLGFASIATGSGGVDDSKLGSAAVEIARRQFAPEFMNRLDKVVVFKSLGEEDLRKVLDIELGRLRNRILAMRPADIFSFELTQRAKDLVLTLGTSRQYGARHLKRTINRLLTEPISNLIATRQVSGGDLIEVDAASGEDCLTFACLQQGLSFLPDADLRDNRSAAVFAPARKRGSETDDGISIKYGLFELNPQNGSKGRVHFPNSSTDVIWGILAQGKSHAEVLGYMRDLDRKIVSVQMLGAAVMGVKEAVGVMVGWVFESCDGDGYILRANNHSFILQDTQVVGDITTGSKIQFVADGTTVILAAPAE